MLEYLACNISSCDLTSAIFAANFFALDDFDSIFLSTWELTFPPVILTSPTSIVPSAVFTFLAPDCNDDNCVFNTSICLLKEDRED